MTSNALCQWFASVRRLGRDPERLRRRLTRRALVLAAAVFTLTSLAGAGSVQVPFSVQADLIAKVASFDRNFAARAGARALVLVMQMPNDAESAAAALELKNALSRVDLVGDRPHEEQIVAYSSSVALAEMIKARKPAIIYFGPGFGKELTAIRNSVSNVSLLTVGATPEYVESGIVLGFDLVSGRPKLLINLSQARKQQVDFPASVLRLMKVYP
jgi:hypothetical protein